MTRRELLNCGAAMGAACLIGRSAQGQTIDLRLETYTYKTVANLAIKADVYYDGGKSGRPIVVWIHGGALMIGSRADIDRRVKKHVLEQGYVLISIDYRLAPETKLPDIVQDLEDAFVWIRRKGPSSFNADPDRIAVVGGSAGGYLTLVSGFRIRPRPTVLMSLWGYGDLIGDWYSTPSPHARHHRSKLSRDEAFGQVSGPAISDARERKGNGGAFYQYCRQTGSWPHAVSGWDPRIQAERFETYMPVKNVTSGFPPTVMIHGTDDTDVPYEQSKIMAEQFKLHNVARTLVSVPDAEHGLAGADQAVIDAAYAKAFAFVDLHLQSSSQ